jgi:FtsP/CotA-like multicopper oxidase with cupredoxin domain/fibronectin type 3 domain-containing protein
MGMESFNDTPLVNGTAYPTLTVDPKAYRFRILSAANDRFFNLSLYQADDTGTEVYLNPDEVAAALEDTTIFPTPLSGTEGPEWIQIGTEGGFLPAPVVIPPQPTTWVNDPTVFNAGNVDQHSLLLGPAERADVIVDFSQFAGQTLILYNDAPAAFPARDPRYDYYTGNADLRDTGGAPSTLPGYGPNTRTVMQIKVNAAPPAPAYADTTLPALQAAFAHQPDGSGVFESSQNPIIVGQAAYNSAYGTSFNTNGPLAGLVQIFNTSFTFNTLLGNILTIELKPKQIQDEMGEAFEHEYGRMSGFLGLEKPGANAGVQNMILYPFVNPVTEIIDAIELPPGVELTPIASTDDGTQIWKITHNGVDTHPIHFHLTDVQLINRVGWDGIIRRPDPNELGWKDTVRISPLEDTIVALRAVLPKTPFGVPDSVRPLNPMMPLGDTSMFNNTDANGDPISPPISNQIVNFGWEYVWHCHILSHEEMDMMRPLSALAARSLPPVPVLTFNGDAGSPINLAWTDGTLVDNADWATWGDPAAEVGYRIERALGAGTFEAIGKALANTTSFVDTSTVAGQAYQYRVVAYNAAGDSPSNIVTVGVLLTPPDAPTNLAASLVFGPQVNLTWQDNADDEDNYIVERSDNGGAFAAVATLGPNAASYSEALQAGASYVYRVAAINGAGRSGNSNEVTVTTPPAPAAPTNLTAQLLATLNSPVRVRLVFRDNANNETGFIIMRQVNDGDWALLATLPRRAGVGNVTYTDNNNVSAGTTYAYRVYAVNGASPSAPSDGVSVTVPNAPAAPASFTGTASVGTIITARINMQWTDSSNNETRFVIQRASNAEFTANVASYNRGANTTSWLQTLLPRRTTFYYRIRAENQYGASAWVNMAPFPIVTP